MSKRSFPSLILIATALLASSAGAATAGDDCAGNPAALGTSRTIVVDPLEHARIGSMQYAETLPLAEKEVVLTFDDGPLPPQTGHVLDILASQCVKATFFMVGRQAQVYPDWVRRVHDAGHTVATHSQTHPHAFAKVPKERAIREVEGGIASVAAALGEGRTLAPFFRFPGFGRSKAMEDYVTSRGLMVWGADAPADDWMRLSADEVVRRAITRLEQKGRGVLLLHDIQRVTVAALPIILHELKERGFRVVHVVPAQPDRPKTLTDPSAWNFRHRGGPVWPAALVSNATGAPVLPVPSRQSFGFPEPFAARLTIPPIDGARTQPLVEEVNFEMRLKHPRKVVWPAASNSGLGANSAPVLPIPGPESLELAFPDWSRPAPVKVGAEHAAALEPRAAQKLASVTPQAGHPSPTGASPAVWSRLMSWFR